jgi:hypothetical protein
MNEKQERLNGLSCFSSFQVSYSIAPNWKIVCTHFIIRKAGHNYLGYACFLCFLIPVPKMIIQGAALPHP